MIPHINPSVRQALQNAMESLLRAGFEEGRLEAGILLSHMLGINRSELISHFEDILSPAQTEELEQLIRRRLNYEPVAYITGYKEFFGLDFHVTPATLIPRPETELLVEKALDLARDRIVSIADIGTGCGAIAIALAFNLPESIIYATDISLTALEITGENARLHGVADRIQLLHGDLLQPLDRGVDIIVANLPYVNCQEMADLSKDIRRHEPELALAGGPEGLDYIDRLLAQAGEKLRPGGAVLLEIGCGQGDAAVELVKKYFAGAGVKVLPDLSGNDRVVMVEIGGRKSG